MTSRQLISIVVLVAVVVMAVQPARAEALDALVIAGVAVLVVFLGVVAVEIIRGRPFHAVDATTDWSLIAFDQPTTDQTP
jgi:hypothetical protein